jgi:hypothetical protein
MKWYDVARDARARNALLVNLQQQNPEDAALQQRTPEDFAEGVCYRPDDGTPLGLWRVAANDLAVPPGERTWIVWDMRRSVAGAPRPPQFVKQAKPIRVEGGFDDLNAALGFASMLAASKVARMAHALKKSLSMAATVPGGIVAHLREEWRL